MALFGRKKNEDSEFDTEGGYSDEEALIEEEEKEDKKLTKKLRDLKKSNRKKRKEPPKPWGKKERMVVLIAACATVLIAIFLAFSSDVSVSSRFSGLKIGFPSFDFGHWNPFVEQTIIIQKK